jgi:hypothetical protein
MSEQSNNNGAITFGSAEEFQAAIAAAVAAALPGAVAAALPSQVTTSGKPAIKSFDINAVPAATGTARGIYYAVAVGCGAESGIFNCVSNQAAYDRALAVVQLFRARGGKFKGNGRLKLWRGIPVDDRDTSAALRAVLYMNGEELNNFRAQHPDVIAQLLSGMDGRGNIINREMAEAADTDTPGRIAVETIKASEAREKAGATAESAAPARPSAPGADTESVAAREAVGAAPSAPHNNKPNHNGRR